MPSAEDQCRVAATLPPGQTAIFGLRLPAFDPAEGDSLIEIALVCEGRFWFSDVGFPSAILALGDANHEDR